MDKNSCYPHEYYASANGFSGFTSIFDDIFKQKDYSSVYVLKGGPGTGKSTLMKKALGFATEKGLEYELIYCSSDPNSLDGIIIKRGKKKIAVIDGTAPHTVDAVYPGCITRIVNLEDGFDIPSLRERTKEIVELSELKKEAYTDAYTMLASAGIIFDRLYGKAAKSFLTEAFDRDFKKEYLCDTKIVEGAPKRLYLSSYGRYGVKRPDTSGYGLKRVSVTGDGITEYVMMNRIKTITEGLGCARVICPHPFSATLYDAVLTDNRVFMTNLDNPDVTISAGDYFTSMCAFDDAKDEYLRLLKLSEKSFDNASSYHFRLEDIYKGSVDFNTIDGLFSKLIEDVTEILSL